MFQLTGFYDPQKRRAREILNGLSPGEQAEALKMLRLAARQGQPDAGMRALEGLRRK